MTQAEQALDGLPDAMRTAVAEAQLGPRDTYEAFLVVLDRDAQASLAAVRLVLAQPAISSQLVDNLNASIHLRALLTDIFHADRWDYVFLIRRPGSSTQRLALIATFEGDVLQRLEAAEGRLPTEEEFVASLAPASAKSAPPAPVLELTPAQMQALPRPAALGADINERDRSG